MNPEDYYLFTVRTVPSGWSRTYAVGDVIRISKICDSFFRDNDEDGCSKYASLGRCSWDIEVHLSFATFNDRTKSFETALICPQCDCIDTSTGICDWSSWSDCSSTCGSGVQTRSRACTYGPKIFNESLIEKKNCSTEACSTEACTDNWTEWGDFEECSDHGAGPYKQQRYRSMCASDGKSLLLESETQDCAETGPWGTGEFKYNNHKKYFI